MRTLWAVWCGTWRRVYQARTSRGKKKPTDVRMGGTFEKLTNRATLLEQHRQPGTASGTHVAISGVFQAPLLLVLSPPCSIGAPSPPACVSVSSCFSCPWCPDTVGLSFQVTSPPWFLVFPALWGSLSMPCRDVPSAMLLIAHPPPGEPPISCFLGVGGSQSHWLQLLRIKTTQN